MCWWGLLEAMPGSRAATSPAVAAQMFSMNEKYLQNGFVIRLLDHYYILLLDYY
jgi:hypothetical protein